MALLIILAIHKTVLDFFSALNNTFAHVFDGHIVLCGRAAVFAALTLRLYDSANFMSVCLAVMYSFVVQEHSLYNTCRVGLFCLIFNSS